MALFGDEEPTRRRRPSKFEKEALYAKQNGKCMYCGRKMDIRDMHVDHKTPIAKGGSNTLSNFQVLCSPCNTRKGSMMNADFRKQFKLTPASKAKAPPAKVVPQKHFDEISSATAKRKAAKRRSKKDDWIW